MPENGNQKFIEINKIYQGDCLKVMSEITDKSIDCILCDLPYGTTACKWDVIIPFEPLWAQYKRIIKDNGAIVLFGSQPFTSMLIMSNLKMFKYEWIWDKKLSVGHLVSKYRPLQITESILIFSRGACSFTKNNNKMSYFPVMNKRKNKRKHIINKSVSELVNKHFMNPDYIRDDYTERFPTNILSFSNADRINKIHPTQKPVALCEYLIKTYTNEGDLVLDNCAGSGTTGVACINTKRNYILIEKEEQYVKIIKKRIKDLNINYEIF